jgi:nicotinamidase-related amidase
MNNTLPTPSNQTALLVIDVQNDLFAKSTPVYRAEILLANICALVDRAHRAGVMVYYIQHTNKSMPVGSDAWQLHPQLHPVDTDKLIQKQYGSAFQGTPLKTQLDAASVTRLVITGLVTHGCVKAACLDAKKFGYTVTLVTDGHSNFHKQAAQVIEEWQQKLSEAGVELKSTAQIEF